MHKHSTRNRDNKLSKVVSNQMLVFDEGKTVELTRDKPLVEHKENLCMNTGHYKMQTADCRLDLKYDKLQNADGRLGLNYRWRPNLSHLLIRHTFSINDLRVIILHDPIWVFSPKNLFCFSFLAQYMSESFPFLLFSTVASLISLIFIHVVLNMFSEISYAVVMTAHWFSQWCHEICKVLWCNAQIWELERWFMHLSSITFQLSGFFQRTVSISFFVANISVIYW